MTGSKFRRVLAGFSPFHKPTKAVSSGAVLTGGNPSGFMLQDTNENSWYCWFDTNGALRIAPAGTVEPNPQTATPSYDFATAAGWFHATPFQKTITGMSDNVFTDVVTFTVPNIGAGFACTVLTTGAIGAGGAIGAFEVVASELKSLSVARVAGVNVVGNLASAGVTSNAAVAGATTLTLTTQLSAITGAVGATNTFTLQARVTKGGGSSSNHTVNVVIFGFNFAATGVSLA